MYKCHVYTDGYWVTCNNLDAMVVVGQGGRMEDLTFVPEDGALLMTFECWLSNWAHARRLGS